MDGGMVAPSEILRAISSYYQPGRSAALAIALLLSVFASQPALAQYEAHPCPGGPGAGEVQVAVAHDGMPMCRRTEPAAPPPPPRIYNLFGSIAWHPDADDVWMSGNWDGPISGQEEALAACNAAMGGGCSSIGEWQNSSMEVARDWNGSLWKGWGANGGTARKEALNVCRQDQPIPCEIIGTFSSGKRRHAPDPALARKRYGAGSWPEDPALRSAAWIATGRASQSKATGAAVAACQQANGGKPCVYAAVTGNGVIQPFIAEAGWKSFLPGTSAKRAAETVKAYCSQKRTNCTVQKSYDSRIVGDFVHRFDQ